MTVKEFINELLECPMGAEVNVLVEMRKDFMKERLNQYSKYSDTTYPIVDDADVKRVQVCSKNRIRIYLSDTSEWR